MLLFFSFAFFCSFPQDLPLFFPHFDYSFSLFLEPFQIRLGEIWLRLWLDSFTTKALNNLLSFAMARPTHSRLTLNHPSKNNSAPCTCLFLHDCIQELGYRNIRCCINGCKPKASAKNLNNCSATGALWSERQNYSQTFSAGLSSFSKSLCNISISRFVPQKSFFFLPLFISSAMSRSLSLLHCSG